MKSTELAEKLNANELAERRNKIEALITKAMDALGEADLMLSTVSKHGLHFERNTIYNPSDAVHRAKSTKDLIKQVDRKFWDRVLELGQFRDLMSVAQRRKIDQDLEQCPRFTQESVTATFGELLKNRPNMLQDLVSTAFLERSKSYKSNQGNKIGKKHVFNAVFNSYGHTNYGCHSFDRLGDVVKAIAKLQGCETPNIGNILFSNNHHEWLNGSVTFKKFKNGNVHMLINDQKIIDRLNNVLAGAFDSQIGE